MKNEKIYDGTIFDKAIKLHVDERTQIINEWGFSSVRLKKYLNKHYNEDINFAHKLGQININYILPPRKSDKGFNGLYGKMAVDRLRLALEAKALILYSEEYKDLENKEGIFCYEALRLFLRIKSFVCFDKDENENDKYQPVVSYDEFNKMSLNALFLAQNDYDAQYKKLLNICNKLRPKYDKILYHYTREDFYPIRHEKNLKEAYNKWMKEVWPTLLDKYKDKLRDEYIRVTLRNMTYEEYSEKLDEYNKKLDNIKIKPIKYVRFTKIIKMIKEGKL